MPKSITPTVWYRNCLYQMEDPGMEYLQSKDTGSCAVWEWLKADSWKRSSPQVRSLSGIEKDCISRRLGITSKRFDNIIEIMMDEELQWITPDMEIRSWQKWQSTGMKEANADRQYVNYWKSKAKEEGDPELPPELQDDKFRIAWEEYLKYRTQNRWKPLRAMSVERKWRELAGWGLDGAIESIEQSIKHGWQGLFQPQSLVKEGGKGVSVWEKTQQLKLVEDEMKELRGRHFLEAPTSKWESTATAQKAKERFIELKKRAKTLKHAIID